MDSTESAAASASPERSPSETRGGKDGSCVGADCGSALKAAGSSRAGSVAARSPESRLFAEDSESADGTSSSTVASPSACGSTGASPSRVSPPPPVPVALSPRTPSPRAISSPPPRPLSASCESLVVADADAACSSPSPLAASPPQSPSGSAGGLLATRGGSGRTLTAQKRGGAADCRSERAERSDGSGRTSPVGGVKRAPQSPPPSPLSSSWLRSSARAEVDAEEGTLQAFAASPPKRSVWDRRAQPPARAPSGAGGPAGSSSETEEFDGSFCEVPAEGTADSVRRAGRPRSLPPAPGAGSRRSSAQRHPRSEEALVLRVDLSGRRSRGRLGGGSVGRRGEERCPECSAVMTSAEMRDHLFAHALDAMQTGAASRRVSRPCLPQRTLVREAHPETETEALCSSSSPASPARRIPLSPQPHSAAAQLAASRTTSPSRPGGAASRPPRTRGPLTGAGNYGSHASGVATASAASGPPRYMAHTVASAAAVARGRARNVFPSSSSASLPATSSSFRTPSAATSSRRAFQVGEEEGSFSRAATPSAAADSASGVSQRPVAELALRSEVCRQQSAPLLGGGGGGGGGVVRAAEEGLRERFAARGTAARPPAAFDAAWRSSRSASLGLSSAGSARNSAEGAETGSWGGAASRSADFSSSIRAGTFFPTWAEALVSEGLVQNATPRPSASTGHLPSVYRHSEEPALQRQASLPSSVWQRDDRPAFPLRSSSVRRGGEDGGERLSPGTARRVPSQVALYSAYEISGARVAEALGRVPVQHVYVGRHEQPHHLHHHHHQQPHPHHQYLQQQLLYMRRQEELAEEQRQQRERVLLAAFSELLPTNAFEEARSASLSEELRKCTICFEEYVDGDIQKRLPCTHSFHRHCIDCWLERSFLCPICKHDLRSNFRDAE